MDIVVLRGIHTKRSTRRSFPLAPEKGLDLLGVKWLNENPLLKAAVTSAAAESRFYQFQLEIGQRYSLWDRYEGHYKALAIGEYNYLKQQIWLVREKEVYFSQDGQGRVWLTLFREMRNNIRTEDNGIFYGRAVLYLDGEQGPMVGIDGNPPEVIPSQGITKRVGADPRVAENVDFGINQRGEITARIEEATWTIRKMPSGLAGVFSGENLMMELNTNERVAPVLLGRFVEDTGFIDSHEAAFRAGKIQIPIPLSSPVKTIDLFTGQHDDFNCGLALKLFLDRQTGQATDMEAVTWGGSEKIVARDMIPRTESVSGEVIDYLRGQPEGKYVFAVVHHAYSPIDTKTLARDLFVQAHRVLTPNGIFMLTDFPEEEFAGVLRESLFKQGFRYINSEKHPFRKPFINSLIDNHGRQGVFLFLVKS
jgi:hypothetical protein